MPTDFAPWAPPLGPNAKQIPLTPNLSPMPTPPFAPGVDPFTVYRDSVRAGANMQKVLADSGDAGALALTDATRLMRMRQNVNRAPVPVPAAPATPVYAEKPAVVPGGFGNEFTQLAETMSAMLSEQRNLTGIQRWTLEQIAYLLRMTWNAQIGDNSQSPTTIDKPLLGSFFSTGGNGYDGGYSLSAYTSGTYLPYYKNVKQYPIGVQFEAWFNTATSGVKFSMSTTDNGRFATLSNAANGVSLTQIKKLLPGETVYAANVDPTTPLNAADVAQVRIYDQTQFIDPNNFKFAPWAGAKITP